MEPKKDKISSIPEAVIYAKLVLPSSISWETEEINNLREEILLQAQGEAVEVSENHPIPLLMITLDVLHKVSPEMVLRLNSGKCVLIFDHWGKPILRDKDIIIINESMNYQEHEDFIPELNINLESIWGKKANIEEDNLRAIRSALAEIKKFIHPTIITTLIGKAPPLLFLLTQHLLYGKTGEIWYQEEPASASIKISGYE